MAIAVNEERLRQDLEETGGFGRAETDTGWGRTVLTGSDANRQARDRLVDEMAALGLDVSVDAVGNILGVWTPSTADPSRRPVVSGSHLDSVPKGGIFDGPLGVYAALEAVRSIREADVDPNRPLGVVSWTEEEGARFGPGLVGSSVAAGVLSAEQALDTTDDDGVALGDALSRIGYDGRERIDPSGWEAWLELHVEQGTRLESSDTDVGVVDAIAGIANCEVTFEGETDHAGATPMQERRDALAAASEFVLANEDAAWEAVASESDTAVATIGKLEPSPGATNVIPGRVEMTMDIRDVTLATIEGLVGRARRASKRIERQRPVTTEFDHYRLTEPSHMADRCVTALEAAAECCGATATRLHSAALHDTANLADVTDTGLVFAPSKGGFSHSPREWTDWEDCTRATQVLATALADLATE